MPGQSFPLSPSILLEPPRWAVVRGARILQAAVAAPSLLYLVTLGIMLFRPPDLDFYHLDRIAFLGLIFCLFLREVATSQSRRLDTSLTWPMLALLLLGLSTILQRPYDASLWAAFAGRWLVPFVLYHLAQLAFRDAPALRQLESFCLLVLAYLSGISIAFLMGVHGVIFPRFILDPAIGIHAERARGPFLQAVANGTTLNLLGLVALNAFRRGRIRGWHAATLLASLPLAILATRTRAVWLSFAASIALLPLVSRNRKLRQAAVALLLLSCLGLVALFTFTEAGDELADRFAERSPVEFRESTYQAGWDMFLEKPLWGWNAIDIQPELARRTTDFRLEAPVFHNSYLDVAVSDGGLGLALYLWLLINLFRLGGGSAGGRIGDDGFVDAHFRALWPMVVGVYLINASFVLMQYQFVNALLFTLAGVVAAQNRLAAASQEVTCYA